MVRVLFFFKSLLVSLIKDFFDKENCIPKKISDLPIYFLIHILLLLKNLPVECTTGITKTYFLLPDNTCNSGSVRCYLLYHIFLFFSTLFKGKLQYLALPLFFVYCVSIFDFYAIPYSSFISAIICMSFSSHSSMLPA